MPLTLHALLIAHASQVARNRLSAQLDLDGYDVQEAPTSQGAVTVLRRLSPRAILLGSLEKPSTAGTFLRELRAGHFDGVDAHVPVITLGTADPVSQLRAYENGSDHHLPVNVAYVLLRAVVAAVVRRSSGPQAAPRVIQLGSLMVDVLSREVSVDGELVDIPAREFELLCTLAVDPTRVFTKQELLKQIWGYEDPRSTRTLDSHACRLRRRLADSGRPGLVRAVWGVGYRLSA